MRRVLPRCWKLHSRLHPKGFQNFAGMCELFRGSYKLYCRQMRVVTRGALLERHLVPRLYNVCHKILSEWSCILYRSSRELCPSTRAGANPKDMNVSAHQTICNNIWYLYKMKFRLILYGILICTSYVSQQEILNFLEFADSRLLQEGSTVSASEFFTDVTVTLEHLYDCFDDQLTRINRRLRSWIYQKYRVIQW